MKGVDWYADNDSFFNLDTTVVIRYIFCALSVSSKKEKMLTMKGLCIVINTGRTAKLVGKSAKLLG